MLKIQTFKGYLNLFLTNSDQSTFLLAVSGGADSMTLLYLFQKTGLKFEVAHVNYKLRGEESDLDQKLVEDFCLNNSIKFHLYEVSEKDRKPENSIQNWARDLRYQFFRNIQKSEKLEYLVTAHHLNDQLETFLINLSKASGIRGLAGIPANENGVLRPLLNVSKEEIYSFAEENNIAFREDASNKKNDYLRNFIRNEIAPKLFETNSHFLQNFGKSLNYLNQTKQFVDQQISDLENKLVTKNDSGFLIQKEKLSEQTDFVKFEILRKFGFEDEKEIAKIFITENGKTFQSKDYLLTIERNELVLVENSKVKNPSDTDSIELTIDEKNEIVITDFLEEEDCKPKYEIWKFDASNLSFPLKLRRKQTDDLFFPIGMIGKKKISKFFKDEKIPILARQKIWLLCDGKNNVLGVVPYRQDGRFSADEKTENILKVKL